VFTVHKKLTQYRAQQFPLAVNRPMVGRKVDSSKLYCEIRVNFIRYLQQLNLCKSMYF